MRTMACCLALGAALAQDPEPFPEHDGFVYPGRPGSEGIAELNRGFDSFSAGLPPRVKGAGAKEVAWMEGRWQVAVRDYVYEPPAPGHIATLGRGAAVISFAPEQKWLRIETDVPRWSAARFLGYDSVAKGWVWQEVLAPGVDRGPPATGKGWADGRLVLGPVAMNFHGFRNTGRVTLVREGDDRFRIVSEVRLSGDRYVAVDDTVFTRAAGPPK